MLSSVYVKEVPELTLITSTDWIAIGSMIVTVIIVVAAAWFQVYQAKEVAKQTRQQLEAEQDLRRRQFIAQSRREWIETLRNEVSEFLSTASEYHTYIIGTYHNTYHSPIQERQRDFILNSVALSNKLLNIRERIELLLNPKPNDKKIKGKVSITELNLDVELTYALNKVLKQLSDIREIVENESNVDVLLEPIADMNKTYIDLLDAVKAYAKVILKNEWERVKRLED
ncbi:MAG: hypothetical protein ACK5MF_06155 [Vibrio sp.]|uniref:hypothetical protein n=1 Tax=Vibrio sp. TaxID=678 RepID=UPI003A8C7317